MSIVLGQAGPQKGGDLYDRFATQLATNSRFDLRHPFGKVDEEIELSGLPARQERHPP
jgi:hypothetical protein